MGTARPGKNCTLGFVTSQNRPQGGWGRYMDMKINFAPPKKEGTTSPYSTCKYLGEKRFVDTLSLDIPYSRLLVRLLSPPTSPRTKHETYSVWSIGVGCSTSHLSILFSIYCTTFSYNNECEEIIQQQQRFKWT